MNHNLMSGPQNYAHGLDRHTWEHRFSRRLAFGLREWTESQHGLNKATARALEVWKGEWAIVLPETAADEMAQRYTDVNDEVNAS